MSSKNSILAMFTGAATTSVPSEKLYGTVLSKVKGIESMLRDLGCQGRGLHELLTSSGALLRQDVMRAARKVATIRNKLVHEVDFSLTRVELESFVSSAEFVSQTLAGIIERRARAAQDRGTPKGRTALFNVLRMRIPSFTNWVFGK